MAEELTISEVDIIIIIIIIIRDLEKFPFNIFSEEKFLCLISHKLIPLHYN
jgi:hypothetical protein